MEMFWEIWSGRDVNTWYMYVRAPLIRNGMRRGHTRLDCDHHPCSQPRRNIKTKIKMSPRTVLTIHFYQNDLIHGGLGTRLVSVARIVEKIGIPIPIGWLKKCGYSTRSKSPVCRPNPI